MRVKVLPALYLPCLSIEFISSGLGSWGRKDTTGAKDIMASGGHHGQNNRPNELEAPDAKFPLASSLTK